MKTFLIFLFSLIYCGSLWAQNISCSPENKEAVVQKIQEVQWDRQYPFWGRVGGHW